MTTPHTTSYVAELERENEQLTQALNDTLADLDITTGERDQLAHRVHHLEHELAWTQHQQHPTTRTRQEPAA